MTDHTPSGVDPQVWRDLTAEADTSDLPADKKPLGCWITLVLSAVVVIGLIWGVTRSDDKPASFLVPDPAGDVMACDGSAPGVLSDPADIIGVAVANNSDGSGSFVVEFEAPNPWAAPGSRHLGFDVTFDVAGEPYKVLPEGTSSDSYAATGYRPDGFDIDGWTTEIIDEHHLMIGFPALDIQPGEPTYIITIDDNGPTAGPGAVTVSAHRDTDQGGLCDVAYVGIQIEEP